jgi:hypothetical protein
MLCSIAGEHGLCSQHLHKPSQTTLERDFARGAAFMRFPAAQLGQQLHLDPVETDAQVKEKARRDPA